MTMLHLKPNVSRLSCFRSAQTLPRNPFLKTFSRLGLFFIVLIFAGHLAGTPLWAQDSEPPPAEGTETEKPIQPLLPGITTCQIPAEGETRLSFTHPGNVYLALKISVKPDMVVNAEVTGAFTGTDFEYTPNARCAIEGTAGPSSLFDGIPQFSGTYTLILTNTAEKPADASIQIVELGPLATVQPSAETGTIIVRKAAEAGISLVPDEAYAGNTSLYHKKYSSESHSYDISPTGDVTLSAPAGMYKIVASAKDLGIGVETHWVPVKPGKCTIIENWPIFEEKPLKEVQGASGLRIRQVAMSDADVRVRFSTPDWKGTIATSELEIYEGGMPGEVLSLKRGGGPLHLIVLLDSSGSMKNDMKKVLEAATAFFQGLEKSATIELIDFDTQPKPLKTKNVHEAVKALKGIKADGATALNDTVIKGIQQGTGADRVALVLFTDGFDANHNDTGPGSKATPEMMFHAVQEGGVPVFTIGYGKKPDETTLKRLAALSGGAYFRAQPDSIGKVFEQLNGILGRDFEMTYRRPGITAPSDVPVVCIVQDRSGSMNMPPDEEKTCGYRMEEAKEILRGFVRGLPENALMQMVDFHMYVTIQQLWTSDRAQILRGISQIFAGGGTDIPSAIDVAIRSLKQVPSRRQYLLFITDLALPSLEDPDFLEQIGRLKDAGIHCTWVGMVNSTERGPFDAVASMTGGFAAVADDPSSLRQAVERLGKQISTERASDNRLEVRLIVGKQDESGKPLVMGDTGLFPLPPSPRTATASVHGIRYRIVDGTMGAALSSTSKTEGASISASAQNTEGKGSASLSTGTIGAWKIERRMEISGSANNKAIKFSPKELLFIDSTQGLEAPEGERLVALHLVLENLKPVSSGSCSISNLRRQMFLQWNTTESIPVSPLTWVGENPLIQPKDEGLTLSPGKPAEGFLVFRVPREGLTSGYLAFYDEQDGHVKIPLVGDPGAPLSLPSVSAASQTPEVTVGSDVSAKVVGFEDRPTWNVDDTEGHLAREFEVELVAKSEQVFSCDPYKQVRLVFHTPSGPWGIAPSLLTSRLPLGWAENLRLAPGVPRRCRLVFVLPEKMAALGKGSLAISHAGVIAEVHLDQPKTGAALKPMAEGKKDGMVVLINRLVAPEVEGRLGVDVTFRDEKDGKPSRLEPGFKLVEGEDEPVLPTESPEQYLVSFPVVVELADGEERRGFVFFEQFTEQAFLMSEPLGFKLAVKPEKLGDAEMCFAERMRPLTVPADPPEWAEPVLRKTALDLIKTREAQGWKKP